MFSRVATAPATSPDSSRQRPRATCAEVCQGKARRPLSRTSTASRSRPMRRNSSASGRKADAECSPSQRRRSSASRLSAPERSGNEGTLHLLQSSEPADYSSASRGDWTPEGRRRTAKDLADRDRGVVFEQGAGAGGRRGGHGEAVDAQRQVRGAQGQGRGG